jgi:hypothetical protein
MSVHLMGMYLLGVYLLGVHLLDVHLLGVHLMGVHLMDVYLTGVHLTGVHLMGMYLMSMYLKGMHLTGAHFMGVHLIGVELHLRDFGELAKRFKVVDFSSRYPAVLRVREFLVLTVQAVDKNLRNIDRHAEMIGLFDNPYPTTSISYPDAYRCAADPSQPEDFQLPDRAPTDPGFWDYLRQRAQHASEEGTPRREGQPGQHSSADLRAKLLPIHMQGFRQFNESAKMPAIGRAFFVSAEGFMGLAPRDTRAGDQIYNFLGANTPFAVRKREDTTFTFLGECYVFGLMHGEAARGCPEDRLKDVLLV